jgi:DNA-binding NarL/FixJ family response regulator
MKTNLETLESQAVASGSGRTPLWAAPELEAERRELTPRQMEILSLIAKGRSNKEIGFALGIRERTVKFHVAALFERLGTSSRTEALVVALRLGVVQLDDDRGGSRTSR